MSDPTPQPRRRPSALLRSLLALVAFVLALLAVEGGNRLWLRSQGRPYGTAKMRATLERILDDPDQLGGAGQQATTAEKGSKERCMHPFFGFDVLGSLVQIGEDREYFEKRRNKKSFDIVLTGGSVAAGFGNHGSARLRELLKADPRLAKRNVRLLNYARASFKQPQQLNVLSYLLNVGIRPDAVINLDGFNEIAVSNGNARLGVHPLQPSVGQWATRTMSAVSDPESLERLVNLRMIQLQVRSQARRALDSGLLWSSLLGNYWLGEIQAGKRRQVALQSEALKTISGDRGSAVVRGPEWAGELEDVMEYCIASWMTSSRAMDAICEREGIHYVHVLQPTLHDEGSKPVTDDERKTGKTSAAWREAVEAGYPKLREAGARLREQGVAFLDATLVFQDVTETLYIDACHFIPDGQRLLAEAIAAEFLATYEP